MAKINLKEFDKLVAEQELLVEQSEKHSLDSIIKVEHLQMLQKINKMIDRSVEKVVKQETTKVKTPEPALPEVEKAEPANTEKVVKEDSKKVTILQWIYSKIGSY